MKFFLILSMLLFCNQSNADYISDRQNLVNIEFSNRLGGKIRLNKKELLANEVLMKHKIKEYEMYLKLDVPFPPALHFFYSKPNIEKSDIFKIIQKMPKGAALHLHDAAIVDINWLIKKATYDPNCYMCYTLNGTLIFRYLLSSSAAKSFGCDTIWKSVVKERKMAKNIKEFDKMLYSNLTIVTENPKDFINNQKEIWRRFQNAFDGINGLAFYEPLASKFYYEGLQEFFDDNVQFIELRSLLPQVYDIRGTTYNNEYMLNIYINATRQFVSQHRDFHGARIIYTSSRSEVGEGKIKDDIKDSIRFYKKYPDYFAGYDIVGFEDSGTKLLAWIEDLLFPIREGSKLPFFFHAGETNWIGTGVDGNLFDALLLNSSRIGHAYAITKHPKILQLIKKLNIALEVCPVSNQVLGLVSDLRNHPMTSLFADEGPVVISSDDPGLWGARGLSYDFYEAFMGLGGQWADLATLKQLAINSIRYSSLDFSGKKLLLNLWNKKWDVFIDELIRY